MEINLPARLFLRFHSFLLFLGHPAYSVREISVHRFSKIISEFALEYRTTRDRVLQQKQKRADHRERNKTRGKMIVEVSAAVSITQTEARQPRGGSAGPRGSMRCLNTTIQCVFSQSVAGSAGMVAKQARQCLC